MRPWQAARWPALLVIFSFLIVFAPLGCGGDKNPQSSGTGGSGTGGTGASSTSTGASSTSTGAVKPPVSTDKLVVHYYRPLADYAGWTLGAAGDTTSSDALKSTQLDAFGARFEVPLKDGSHQVNLTLQSGQTKEPNGDLAVDLQRDGKEVWVYSESPRVYTAAPAIPAAGTAIVYYRRSDNDYQGYGLYPFNDTTDTPPFDKPLAQTGVDQFGAYFTVHLKPDAKNVGLIVHKNGNKDPGPDQLLKPAEKGRRIWILSGDINLYTYPAELPNVPVIDAVRAHWVSADTIAWNLTGDDATLGANTYQLHYDPAGAIKENNGKLEGGKTLSLTYDKAGLSAPIKAKFPHLAAYKALKISAADADLVPEILKGQILVSTSKPSGTIIGSTGLQIPGVLDDLYTETGDLGVLWNGGVLTLKLWAPTARSVKVHLFDDPNTPTESSAIDLLPTGKGAWSVDADVAWKGKYYLYEVEVFVHATGKVEHNLVTDPYSVNLSANSKRSQIIDLSDPALAPPGWLSVAKPALAAPSDITLYELHVRDFSINDATVPANHRGTFTAFTDTGSNGMKHLAGLAAAGLSHVHVLPSFDFATINEIKSQQQSPGDLTAYAPDGAEQQTAVATVSDTDGFNWGYDPLHFTVPEGSYATDPDGINRVVEFRQMVKSLNEAGLRMVMDVVYNHMSASGQDPKSILDRVVPGYYHRLNAQGGVETSTCCQNTATEHAMMEKLMVDSLVTWARAYKVDGFRFDLMGHHMKSNLVKVRAALDALTLAKDGVDGKAIYLYGEGWDYGEVGGGLRGVNATQPNMAGTGIGTFNDRLRDAVRGGGPFDSGASLQKQGFVSGLFYEPNALDQGTPAEQKDKLLLSMDQIRVGLTGNLKDYTFVDRKGATVTGANVDYNGQPAGYTASPVEGITYAEAHDGQTLFDIIQYKAAASTNVAARVRMQNLAVDILALGQGIPFFHAGVEILRSKSLDKNSFNSGDWFNTLDFTYTSNNWGVGLPPAKDNMGDWSLIKPLLADPLRKPAQADILAALSHFKTMLQIRKSSKLFRLGTADDVTKRVRFLNTGTGQTPGLLVMSISDKGAGLPDLDPSTEGVLVFVNATNAAVSFGDPIFATSTLTLHPIQQALVGDPVLGAVANGGMFSIPPRTTAVFVGTGSFP